MRLAATLVDYLSSRADDHRIWVLDADLGDSYGMSSIRKARFGERAFQAGIAEQSMVSIAAGLAACGARPFVFSFAAFLCSRAYDQIRTCISHTGLPVVLVGSHAGGCSGRNGKSHALVNDVAIIASLPNIDIWAPADASELPGLVEHLLASSTPAYIRLPRDPQRLLGTRSSPLHSWGTIRDFAILSTGLATHWALEARQALAALEADVPVIHVSRLEPLPTKEIHSRLKSCSRLLVIEDHSVVGGLGDMVRRSFADRRVDVLGWPRNWSGASGDSEELRRSAGLASRDIVLRCKECLARPVCQVSD